MNQIIAWTLFSVFGATYLYLIWLGRKIGSLKFDISVLDNEVKVIQNRLKDLEQEVKSK